LRTLSVSVSWTHRRSNKNTPSMLLQRLWRLWPRQPRYLFRAIANNASSACQSVLPYQDIVLGEFFTVISLSLF
jgi:hypothetical protein